MRSWIGAMKSLAVVVMTLGFHSLASLRPLPVLPQAASANG